MYLTQNLKVNYIIILQLLLLKIVKLKQTNELCLIFFSFAFPGKISAQPHTLIMYTFCDSNSIHVRSLCKRISVTFVHV